MDTEAMAYAYFLLCSALVLSRETIKHQALARNNTRWILILKLLQKGKCSTVNHFLSVMMV